MCEAWGGGREEDLSLAVRSSPRQGTPPRPVSSWGREMEARPAGAGAVWPLRRELRAGGRATRVGVTRVCAGGGLDFERGTVGIGTPPRMVARIAVRRGTFAC